MKIYTVIPYYSNGDVFLNDVKSFTTFKNAQLYAWSLDSNYDITESELD